MKNNNTNFYAVRNGRNPGIYNTKEDCERQINGFSGAEYQTCQTWQEARNYVLRIMINPISQSYKNVAKYRDESEIIKRISQPPRTNKRKLREDDKEDRIKKL